jgi:hypothetical protein
MEPRPEAVGVAQRGESRQARMSEVDEVLRTIDLG